MTTFEEEDKENSGGPNFVSELQDYRKKADKTVADVLDKIHSLDVMEQATSEIDAAQRKVNDISHFEREILEMTAEAVYKVDLICDKIRANMYSSESKEGILRFMAVRYTNCFNIDLEKMKRLLQEDMKAWDGELRAARENSQAQEASM